MPCNSGLSHKHEGTRVYNLPSWNSDQRAETAAVTVLNSKRGWSCTAPMRKVSSLEVDLILALQSRNYFKTLTVDPCHHIRPCKTPIVLHRWIAIHLSGSYEWDLNHVLLESHSDRLSPKTAGTGVVIDRHPGAFSVQCLYWISRICV